MKIIFSQWTNANSSHPTATKQMAALSNYFAKVNGYETILFADKGGRDFFKNIDYSEIRELPEDILEKFPINGWSLGKLLACTLIDEPFYHLDFDFLLGRQLSVEQLNYEALFFHHEIWMDKILKNSSFIIRKSPSLIGELDNFRSYNCAIFGGQNFKAFHKAAKNIYEFAIEHAVFLQRLSEQQDKLKNKNLVKFYLHFAMVLEQLWLPQALMKEGIEIKTLISNKETDVYESTDYSKDVDPKNLDTLEFSLKEKDIYKMYYNLLNKICYQNGHVHYYAQNKNNSREKIEKMVKIHNLKY